MSIRVFHLLRAFAFYNFCYNERQDFGRSLMVDDIKILIVEDDALIVKMLQSLLEQEGYTVYVSNDGIHAIHVLEELIPHLIICDVMMPRMDGHKFREIIMQDLELQLVPFIFLTALSSPQDKIKGFQLEADDYITKPFEPDEFLARVRQKISKFKLYYTQITYDALTTLYNRRFLMTQLMKELERVKRFSHKLSVIMIDLDTFKDINDSHGHTIGDAVLRAFAEALKSNMRSVDFAGRYGGEEFVIVMPEMDKDTSLIAAERIRSTIAALPVTEKNINVSFSGGVASAPEDGLDVKTLLLKADKALYQAKKSGRNKIVPYHTGTSA